MLVLAIVMIGLAMIVTGFTVAGAVGVGAVGFALGFAVLAAVALMSFFTKRAAGWPSIPLSRFAA